MGSTSSFSKMDQGRGLIHIDTDPKDDDKDTHRNGHKTNGHRNSNNSDNAPDPFYMNMTDPPSMTNYDPEEVRRIMNQSLNDFEDEIIENDTGNTVLFIGKNTNGEAGLGHNKSIKKLTELPSWIEYIYSGNAYTVYSGNNNKILYASGSNFHGACAIGNIKPNIIKHTKITYFNEENINNIDKICINPAGSCTFWITDDNKIYGNGANDKYQLGLAGKSNKAEPMLIRALQSRLWKIIDVQSALQYSIALASTAPTAKMIIKSWVRECDINTVPNDIVTMITTFYENNRIYSTEHGHGTVDDENMNGGLVHDKWSLLKDFYDVNIVQIRTGYMHSLFLDSTGNVWSCGSNLYGQLGNKKNDGAFPLIIPYFIDKNIKIKEISVGAFHNLALDINNKVYSWGFNYDGQCGDGSVDNIKIPKLINDLKYIEVLEIKCGYHHNYCKSKDGSHFIFGKNQHNECITDNNKIYISKPFRINDIINKYYPDSEIKSISLGQQNTKLILERCEW